MLPLFRAECSFLSPEKGIWDPSSLQGKLPSPQAEAWLGNGKKGLRLTLLLTSPQGGPCPTSATFLSLDSWQGGHQENGQPLGDVPKSTGPSLHLLPQRYAHVSCSIFPQGSKHCRAFSVLSTEPKLGQEPSARLGREARTRLPDGGVDESGSCPHLLVGAGQGPFLSALESGGHNQRPQGSPDKRGEELGPGGQVTCWTSECSQTEGAGWLHPRLEQGCTPRSQ